METRIFLKAILAIMPDSLQVRARSFIHNRRLDPGFNKIRFGSLRRTQPISRQFGSDRGKPIDRYYIEKFLHSERDTIAGRVLEVGENTYTRKYGGSAVTQSDVLHVIEGNPQATIVADITHADNLPENAFDCIVFTQTLHLVFDLQAAMQNLYRMLKPGGVLLITVPGISQVQRCVWGDDWHWSLTARSLLRLTELNFESDSVRVNMHGNVLVAISFLHGIATEELTPAELDEVDEEYQVLLTLKATKRAT